MKLSKDQKLFLKIIPGYALGYFIMYPLIRWICGHSITWDDILTSLLVAVCTSLLGILIYVIGSHVPTKDD